MVGPVFVYPVALMRCDRLDVPHSRAITVVIRRVQRRSERIAHLSSAGALFHFALHTDVAVRL